MISLHTTIVVEDIDYATDGSALALGSSTNIIYKQIADEDSNYVVAFSSAFNK